MTQLRSEGVLQPLGDTNTGVPPLVRTLAASLPEIGCPSHAPEENEPHAAPPGSLGLLFAAASTHTRRVAAVSLSLLSLSPSDADNTLTPCRPNLPFNRTEQTPHSKQGHNTKRFSPREATSQVTITTR